MSTLDDKAIDLAQRLIRCPSVTPYDEGALDVLVKALRSARFAVEKLNFTEDGTAPVDNLFARIGEGSPHLCFAGHTDVVPPGDETAWTHPPFAAKIADRKLYGRGAADMKGGIACFAAAALDYVKTKGGEIDGSISLLITGDEEGPGINGTPKVLAWMDANNHRPDHCLVGEPTNSKKIGDGIKIGRRGSLNGMLKVSGVQGHVAYPHLASNPIKGLVQALARLYETPLDYGSAHFSPSNFEVTSVDVGNKATNVIPSSVEARFNIRYNDKHSPETLKSHLREQVQLALSPTGLTFTLDFDPPSHQFLTQLGPLDALLSQAVNEVTGLIPVLSTEGGTSDARFIKDYCPVVEFGLLSETIHKVDEHVAIADLNQLTAVYRRFIELYFETFGARDEK